MLYSDCQLYFLLTLRKLPTCTDWTTSMFLKDFIKEIKYGNTECLILKKIITTQPFVSKEGKAFMMIRC